MKRMLLLKYSQSMRTFRNSLVLFAMILITGCSSKQPAPSSGSSSKEVESPGMIPNECETLLNKSQEWGYVPGQKLVNAPKEKMLEIAKFFASFHLIPETSSQLARALLRENEPTTEAEAKESLERLTKGQSCNVLLAHSLLQAVLEYPWAKDSREEVGKALFQFVHHQQMRAGNLLSTAVQLDVYHQAIRKGLAPGNAKAVANIRSWLEKERSQMLSMGGTTALEKWKISRREAELDEETREKLARVLPLP